MPAAIRAVMARQDLSAEAMTQVMQTIMGGSATPAQIGGFLIGLAMKGETVTEIAAAAQVMRQLATQVEVAHDHLVDTCGTGGDGMQTFNISTASAMVAAAAGARVAKHGNRAASSRSGSADVLEAAGVRLDLNPAQVAAEIDQVGVGFLFAPAHHGAMRHAIGPRREMRVRTIFNFLGPLTNPANARRQVLGVFALQWVEPLALVLRQLGSEHVMVVHSQDGLDEISINAPTEVAELKAGRVSTYTLTPEQLGFKRQPLDPLKVDSPQESLALIRRIFANEPGPGRDIVTLNAGAAIYVAGLAASLEEGITCAEQAISSGAAARVLAHLVSFSQEVKA